MEKTSSGFSFKLLFMSAALYLISYFAIALSVRSGLVSITEWTGTVPAEFVLVGIGLLVGFLLAPMAGLFVWPGEFNDYLALSAFLWGLVTVISFISYFVFHKWLTFPDFLNSAFALSSGVGHFAMLYLVHRRQKAIYGSAARAELKN